MLPALFYRKEPGAIVHCQLCPHSCRIKPGQCGICGVRKNIGGELFSLNSDRLAALHNDPIEKKPLYHFHPGSSSLSLGASGCNLSCIFCQNHTLSMIRNDKQIQGEQFDAAQIVELARRQGARSISYTYSEPTVFFELIMEVAPLAREAGLANVLVSNGYISPEPLEKLFPLIDAANIDLKAYSEEFYRKHCRGTLAPVRETIRALVTNGVWTEVTTLLIPGMNSDRNEVRGLISFLTGISTDLVWHISRFFPHYLLLDVMATPPALIAEYREMAREEGLRYVYGGNLPGDEFNNTCCPNCSALLVEREGYDTRLHSLQEGRCGSCGTAIAGVWN